MAPEATASEETHEKLSIPYWNARWAAGQTGWRANENIEIPPFADNIQYAETAAGRELVLPGKTAFVPLCGESDVVIFLAQQGMTVVGLEGAALAVTALRKKVAELPKEVQERVHIVECDYFKFTPGSPEHLASEAKKVEKFDFIYDRASFIAIDPKLRTDYISVLNSWAAPGTTTFLEGIIRKKECLTDGPPHNLPCEDVGKYYGDSWKVSFDEKSVVDPETVEERWSWYKSCITKQ